MYPDDGRNDQEMIHQIVDVDPHEELVVSSHKLERSLKGII